MYLGMLRQRARTGPGGATRESGHPQVDDRTAFHPSRVLAIKSTRGRARAVATAPRPHPSCVIQAIPGLFRPGLVGLYHMRLASMATQPRKIFIIILFTHTNFICKFCSFYSLKSTPLYIIIIVKGGTLRFDITLYHICCD